MPEAGSPDVPFSLAAVPEDPSWLWPGGMDNAARRRAAMLTSSLWATDGISSSTPRNSRLPMTINSMSVAATTVADRGPPSSNAISPK